jgi:hypothetical protein
LANVKTQTCDICGIQRQPSNHWFKVFKVEGGLLILTWEASSGPDGEARNPEDADAHLCGATHVVEWGHKEFFAKVLDG